MYINELYSTSQKKKPTELHSDMKLSTNKHVFI